MKLYESNGYCFVCGASAPLEKLNVKDYVPTKTIPDNIPDVLDYIQTLPTKSIRGLPLHYDSRGFYIVWPERNYYKRRNFDGKARYTGPKGHRSSLLVYPGPKDLVLIEGELNALSVHTFVRQRHTIASPGSAAEFKRHLPEYLKYRRIVLVLDNDAAGIAHGIEVKNLLLKECKNVKLVFRDMDYNDVLQQFGPDELRDQFEKDVT